MRWERVPRRVTGTRRTRVSRRLAPAFRGPTPRARRRPARAHRRAAGRLDAGGEDGRKSGVAFPPSWMPRIARWSLLFAVIAAVGGGVSYAGWASDWNRPKPKYNRCFPDSMIRLMKPETQMGTAAHDTLDGRTVYLTAPAAGAVRCAERLGKTQAARLADAMGDYDPEGRAARLVGMMEAVPRDPSGDLDALALGRLAGGALKGLPSSDVVIAAQKRVGDLTDCRFGGPACQNRPPIPLLAWAGGGLSIAGLLIGASAIARGAAGQRRAPKRKGPARTKTAKVGSPEVTPEQEA